MWIRILGARHEDSKPRGTVVHVLHWGRFILNSVGAGFDATVQIMKIRVWECCLKGIVRSNDILCQAGFELHIRSWGSSVINCGQVIKCRRRRWSQFVLISTFNVEAGFGLLGRSRRSMSWEPRSRHMWHILSLSDGYVEAEFKLLVRSRRSWAHQEAPYRAHEPCRAQMRSRRNRG